LNQRVIVRFAVHPTWRLDLLSAAAPGAGRMFVSS
jgi:hypothetical protein